MTETLLQTHRFREVFPKHASLDGDICISRSCEDAPTITARITLEHVPMTAHDESRVLVHEHNPCAANPRHVRPKRAVPQSYIGTRIFMPVCSRGKDNDTALSRLPVQSFERNAGEEGEGCLDCRQVFRRLSF